MMWVRPLTGWGLSLPTMLPGANHDVTMALHRVENPEMEFLRKRSVLR
jgi:hypothetical protein